MAIRTEMEMNLSRRIVDYEKLNAAVIDIVSDRIGQPRIWLDTGCGTGGLVRDALERFPGTQFVLADPSEENIALAKQHMNGEQRCLYVTRPTEDLNFGESTLDAVTAILCHHYYRDLEDRKKAVMNCARMLRKGGVFITVEHVRNPEDEAEEKDREWISYMMSKGLPEPVAKVMTERRDTEYFPLEESVHLSLLKECGLSNAEVFWRTCSDIGIVAFR